MSQRAGIRVGVGGWTFEPWRGSFYPRGLPQKRELEYASRHLTSIEVNGTYYGAQKPESFIRWREETPDGFVFSLKGPRFTTNRRLLAEAGASIERFLTGGVLELKEKLGPINWQMLPTKQYDPEDFEAFLKLLPAQVDGQMLRHVVEVRHPSFARPDFIALLRAYGVAAVMADNRQVSGTVRRDRAVRLFAAARRVGTGGDGVFARGTGAMGGARAVLGSGEGAGGSPADRGTGSEGAASTRSVHLYDQWLQAEGAGRGRWH